MNAPTASLINALSLIILSLWGYFGSDAPSFTALIPAFIGILLLLTYKGLRNENKTISHIAVILTIVLLIALLKPLTGVLARNDTAGLIRIVVMMATTVLAIAYFVKIFVTARRKRMQ